LSKFLIFKLDVVFEQQPSKQGLSRNFQEFAEKVTLDSTAKRLGVPYFFKFSRSANLTSSTNDAGVILREVTSLMRQINGTKKTETIVLTKSVCPIVPNQFTY
jgi:hypothetical protein